MNKNKLPPLTPTSYEKAVKDKGLIGDVQLSLKEGRKIEAVKHVRWYFNWRLLEAKRFVDKIENGKI